MACNCGGRNQAESLRLGRAQPTPEYGYATLSFPDCTAMHKGKWQGLTIYFVGRNTEHEMAFNHSELVEASAYSRLTRQYLEAYATADVCDDLVVEANTMPLADRMALYAQRAESRKSTSA